MKEYSKHSSIDIYVSVTVTHISDITNTLQINKYNIPAEYAEQASTLPKTSISECALFIKTQLALNGEPIDPILTSRQIRQFAFNETFIFPVKYKELTNNAWIYFSIYDMNTDPEKGLVARTTLDLFDSKKCLRQGYFTLQLYKSNKKSAEIFQTNGFDAMGLTENRFLVERNNLFNYKTQKESQYKTNEKAEIINHIEQKLCEIERNSDIAMMDIKLPIFGVPVIHFEEPYDLSFLAMQPEEFEKIQLQKKNLKEQGNEHYNEKIDNLTIVYDPAVMDLGGTVVNPDEERYSVYLRNEENNEFAKDIKPTQTDMELLEKIALAADFDKCTKSEENNLWKFRYSLISKGKYLPVFLKTYPSWNDKEMNEAKSLMKQWQNIELEHILPLLSFTYCTNPFYIKQEVKHMEDLIYIRQFAVEQLKKVEDDSVEQIILQLIQALRYESPKGTLKDFLFDKALSNDRKSFKLRFAISLYWHLYTEKENQNNPIKDYFASIFTEYYGEVKLIPSLYSSIEAQMNLRDKLLKVNREIKKKGGSIEAKNKYFNELTAETGLYNLRKIPPTLLPVDPTIITNGIITGDKRSFVLKSSTSPMKVEFGVISNDIKPNIVTIKSNDNSKIDSPDVIPASDNTFKQTEYSVLYKEGDDLRQDELAMQIFSIMDKILKKVNIDLEFTIYRVCPCTITDGFTEFVMKCKTIRKILAENSNKISSYFQKLGNGPSIIEKYIRSCAGYCAATYILGVGDRHLDNIMLKEDGKLFHLDFGFILGQDPKIYPPLIRINNEMIEGMEGQDGEFKKKCVDAFNYLRMRSKYLVNLLHLMIHSGIKDLVKDAKQRVKGMYDRMLPGKNNDDAGDYLLFLLDDCMNAFMPKVIELFHNIKN